MNHPFLYPSTTTTAPGQEAAEAAETPVNPDALAVIDRVDLGGRPLGAANRDEAARTLTLRLADGWTPAALQRAFDGCVEGARNPVGVFMTRLRDLGPPPGPRDAPTQARAAPGCEHCEHGWIETPTGVARCPRCTPPHG